MHIIQSKLSTLLPIKNKTKNNKLVICQLHSMQLQKELKSNPKQPSCKKVCSPQECCCEKSYMKSKVAAKKWL